MEFSIVHKVLDKSRSLIAAIAKNENDELVSYTGAEFEGQIASDLIRDRLNDNSPCMIARFGSTELNIVTEYCNSLLGPTKYFKYIMGSIDSYRVRDKSMRSANLISGIFPSNKKIIEQFAELSLEDMKAVDILGSWRKQEDYFNENFRKASKVRLPDLEPYFHHDPWSSALAGKNVIVIHPFAETIQAQYTKRKKLFENPLVLPDFNLQTIKSVQSLAGEKVDFSDWFDALDYMKAQINNATFDIAIIGCGAYGFPLAAYVKRIGKKAIHLGGATQLLFGIKGSRWKDHKIISQLFNEHWVHPSENETPKRYDIVEGGSYW